MSNIRLGLTLPHLKTGGIERGMVTLLNPLHQMGIQTTLFLQDKSGDLLADVPDATRIVPLRATGVRRGSKALAALLKNHPVDILWSATNATNVLNLIAARRLGKHAPRVVIGEHIPLESFVATRKFPALRRSIMRFAYPKAHAITAPLQPILTEHQNLLGRKCPPCTVLPNPVIQNITKGAKISNVAKNFVTLGRLSPEKDFALALRTFAEVSKTIPDAQLTLFGEGSERSNLQKLITELDLEHRVAMPGLVANAAEALAGTDMLWCTSHMEGFGNVLVEAQSLGVPVASVDCPFGPRALLKDGGAGCLIRSRDPIVLAKAIETFATNQGARIESQRAGYEVAAENTVASSVEAHVTFFKGLMHA